MCNKKGVFKIPDEVYAEMLKDTEGLSSTFENWQDVRRVFSSGGLATIKTKDGLTLHTDRAGLLPLWETFVKKSWTRHFSVEKGDTVVDIGAHHGLFACFAARNASHIHCYEPVPGNVAFLRKNVDVNNLRNVMIHEKAVGKAGEIEIGLAGDSVSHSEFHAEDRILGRLKVESVSLTSIVRRLGKIDFLKMNCEGCEFTAIASLRDRDMSKIKKAAIQYHCSDERLPNFLVKTLKESGMNVNREKIADFQFRKKLELGFVWAYRD